MIHKYIFPLSIQVTLPEDYRQNDEFKKDLTCLQKHGFSGLELNIAYPEHIDFEELLTFLDEFNLEFKRFASGLTAKTLNLSLSSNDIYIRDKAVEKVIGSMHLMKGICSGIILGFFKGIAGENNIRRRKLFIKSIKQIIPYAEESEVPIIVESTNFYESSVANTLDDTYELLEDFIKNPYVQMLPDTFHMNIEETNIFLKMEKYLNYYKNVHLSDNNRYFPGHGAFNFKGVVDFLREKKYHGELSIEGRLNSNFRDDVNKSMEYLGPILSK